MKFKDIKNVSDLIDYCKQNKKWTYKQLPQNDFDVEIVFVYYSTPLLFVTSSGDIYYMSEYTKDNFISITTCWYLAKCYKKFNPLHRIQFKSVMRMLDIEVGKL